MVPTLTPAFIIPEGIGGGISGGGGSVATTAAGVVAAGVIVGGLAVVAAPVVGALAAKAAVLTTAGGPGLLAIGAFLKGLGQLRDWGLINYRPQPIISGPEPGDRFSTGSSVNAGFTLLYDDVESYSDTIFCPNGLPTPATFPPSTTGRALSLFGTGVEIGVSAGGSTAICGAGENVPAVTATSVSVVQANGSAIPQATIQVSRTTFNGLYAFKRKNSNSNFRIVSAGVTTALTKTTQPDFAPGTRPQLFPQTLPDAPPLPAPPLREPLQTPTLPPPPDRRPLAPPVTIPRPGQQPAQVPVPGPRPGPAPGPGPSPTPSQPAPAGVPAIGPLPLPIPLPVPTTPGSVVIVDGQPIGGPGQAPAPNLVAIATELGRLERKNEILLSRPENGGGLGPIDDVLSGLVRGLLEAVLEAVTGGRAGGTFTLAHACPPSGGGDPPAPVAVAYGGAGNPIDAVSAKLDGIAGLIQAHKTMRQPMCRTPLVGEEVTIHFESDG